MNKILEFKKPNSRKPKIGVIIQARMTSTRFPGKSTAELMGKPVIEHVISACKKIRGPKSYGNPWVVVAVPDEPESEEILKVSDRLGVGNFLGSKLNVLDRYFHAAAFFNFDIIVRITGDCPFLDPRVCSECLQLLIWRSLDYTSNCYPQSDRSYPKGLDCEVFSFDALEAAHKLAINLYDLEHVTPWMQQEAVVKKAIVKQKENQSHINLCVDYPWDIDRLELLHDWPVSKTAIWGEVHAVNY